MQSGFKWALGIILLIVFLLGLLVFVLPSFVKPDFVKQFLTETVEKHTGFLLALDQPEFSIFPIPSFQFKNVKVRNKTDSSTTPAFLTADQIQCELRVFPLLFKQVEFAKVKFSGMTVKLALPTEGRFFHLREINLTLENVRSNDWIKFSLEGKWLGEEPNLFIKGKAKANFNPWSWNQTILNADLDLRNVSAGKLLEWLGLSWSGQVKEGVVSVTAGLSKLENTSALSATTKLILDQLVYYLTLDPTNTSKPVRYDLGVDASVDFDTQVLSLTNIQLVTPFATVQGKGGVDLVNQKLEGVQLNADAILLDDLPKYFLTLARVLPLNLGFSGEAKADLLLQGGWEQLEVGAKIDLSKALLTYSRYFNKPKSTPLLITTDEFTVKRAREFDGGVDITLADAKFKGSLVKFDIISKVGEATFVTNLIPLAGAQTYLPTFTGYEFTGSAKFFANGKGDFQNPGKMVFMYHTALDDVSARAGENPPLFQNLNGAIDGGPLDVETKDIRFDFGNTHFSVQIKMFFYEKKLYVVIQSPALDLRNFVLQFEKVFQVLALPKDLVDWEKLEQTVANLVQPSVNLENFTLGVVKEGEKLRIENLSFDVYGGRVAMTGWIDFSSSEPPPAPSDSQGAVNPPPPVVEPAYEFRFEIQNVSLARMLRRDIAVPVEGNLFSVVHVSGKGFSKEAVQTQLKGEGSVSITNGEFRTFDIVGSLGQVAELVGLGQFISGTTRFHDMKAEFQIANGKVTTDHIFLYSNDFDIDASGEADFDGNLNFRLDTVLSNALSRKIDRRLNDTDRLGPIPLLLTGKIDSPSLRPDPSLIQDFLRNLIERQLGKILAGRDWFKKAGFVSDQAEEPQKATPPASQETEQNLLGAGATLLESLFSKGENKSSST